MQRFEYKVVPAPRKAEKIRGMKRTDDRFAHALSALMNDLGRDGWLYLRADTLPCEERVGLTGRTNTFQHMLVFHRALPVQDQAVQDQAAPDRATQTPATVSIAAPVPATEPLAAAAEMAKLPAAAVSPPSEGHAPRIKPAVNGATPALGTPPRPETGAAPAE